MFKELFLKFLISCYNNIHFESLDIKNELFFLIYNISYFTDNSSKKIILARTEPLRLFFMCSTTRNKIDNAHHEFKYISVFFYKWEYSNWRDQRPLSGWLKSKLRAKVMMSNIIVHCINIIIFIIIILKSKHCKAGR